MWLGKPSYYCGHSWVLFKVNLLLIATRKELSRAHSNARVNFTSTQWAWCQGQVFPVRGWGLQHLEKEALLQDFNWFLICSSLLFSLLFFPPHCSGLVSLPTSNKTTISEMIISQLSVVANTKLWLQVQLGFVGWHSYRVNCSCHWRRCGVHLYHTLSGCRRENSVSGLQRQS